MSTLDSMAYSIFDQNLQNLIDRDFETMLNQIIFLWKIPRYSCREYS